MEFENKAKYAENEGDYLSAIEYYLQALKSLKKINLKKTPKFSSGNILNHMATLYTEIGDFDKAIEHYKNAIKIYLRTDEYLIKIYPKMGECFSKIGICFLAKSNYEIALENFNKSIEYNERYIKIQQHKPLHYIVKCTIFNLALSTLCLINLNQKNEDIINNLQKAIELSEKYKIKGFVTDLNLFFSYLIDEKMSDAYKILKNEIENTSDAILSNSILQEIVIGLIIDLAAIYIPGVRIRIQNMSTEDKGKVILTRKIYEDMLLYGLSFANRKIPHIKCQEVIALLIGKIENNGVIISEIFPMTSGSESEVEFKDEHYAKASIINSKAAERNEFIIGWYHTHPGLGLFLSATDIINQLGYQSLNEKAIAIVFDFTQLTSSSSGFSIYRLDDSTRVSGAYHSVPWQIKNTNKKFYSESFFFFNRFLANLNHILLENQRTSLAQLAEELNRSETLLEEILPKLVELQYLPNTYYNPETKIISKKKNENY